MLPRFFVGQKQFPPTAASPQKAHDRIYAVKRDEPDQTGSETVRDTP